jgi:hypothetical protein
MVGEADISEVLATIETKRPFSRNQTENQGAYDDTIKRRHPGASGKRGYGHD